MKLGLPANGVKNNESLQYCTACIRSDRDQFGTAYWHRSHQLPGVKICHKHHLWLKRSMVWFSQRRNKHEFISLESIIELKEYSDSRLPCEDRNQIFIAEESHRIISLGNKFKYSHYLQ
ncbi:MULTISPECIES: TniQ family protein [Paenibacillus]|uniref:TniQ family protein n=1 Tax=Paenibacillus TaxID=44249 RepID=UPI001BCA8F7A